MDRVLYLAMSGAKQTMLAQAINTNNLANVSTTGFKEDLAQFRSMQVFGPGMPTRVYAMTERPGLDMRAGPIQTTGRELDVAIRGQGLIAVQGPDGNEAYTRRGDLQISANGILMTGAGEPVIGNNGGPIAIPPAASLEIAGDGTISINPVGENPNVRAEVDRIKLVNAPADAIEKGEDGLIHLRDGGIADPDAGVQIVSGALEGSNVNAVESMVKMIELARQYEMQVKAMQEAEKNDESATGIMRMA